jgi:hypothetical protein
VESLPLVKLFERYLGSPSVFPRFSPTQLQATCTAGLRTQSTQLPISWWIWELVFDGAGCSGHFCMRPPKGFALPGPLFRPSDKFHVTVTQILFVFTYVQFLKGRTVSYHSSPHSCRRNTLLQWVSLSSYL